MSENYEVPTPVNFSAEQPYPDFTQISAVRISFILVYVAVMILALFGNVMVCYTVFRNKKMHTVVNYYIVNLGVSDFMVGFLVLPVKLIEMTAPAEWGVLNDTLCTVLLYVPTIVVFASVLTLVATCFERYFAIVHPLESRLLHSKSRVTKIILCVWLIPSLAAAPFLKPAKAITNKLTSSYGTIHRQACIQTLDDNFRRYYYTFLFFVFYFIPLMIITCTCIRISCCLLTGIKLQRQGTLRRQEINRRKIAKMVIVVAIVFAICWTPYFTITMVTQYHPVNYLEHQNYYFTMLIINLFAFMNSCVNPFIYASMSVRFRNGFKSILKPVCGDAVMETRKVNLRNHVHHRLNDVRKMNGGGGDDRRDIKKRYLTTKTRRKNKVKKDVGSTTTSPSSAYGDMQLMALLRLGSLRSFSGVLSTRVLSNRRGPNIPPPSPTLETMTRTSRLTSISTSRRSSNNSRIGTPEDILSCPTYKHWVREMERTELFQKTSNPLPVRERASSFSAPGVRNNDDVSADHINRRTIKVQFGGVVEHSHSAMELQSSRHSDPSEVPQMRDMRDFHRPQYKYYCLDLAMSFGDRKVPNDPPLISNCTYSCTPSPPPNCDSVLEELRHSTWISSADKNNSNVRKVSCIVVEGPPRPEPELDENRQDDNFLGPNYIPKLFAPAQQQTDLIRRSTVQSNRELSTCDEESESVQIFHTAVEQMIRRSTSDTVLNLFPHAINETRL